MVIFVRVLILRVLINETVRVGSILRKLKKAKLNILRFQLSLKSFNKGIKHSEDLEKK